MTMYVITHKHFDYKKLPAGYKPILVGANKNKNHDNFITDNTGENISDKNKRAGISASVPLNFTHKPVYYIYFIYFIN